RNSFPSTSRSSSGSPARTRRRRCGSSPPPGSRRSPTWTRPCSRRSRGRGGAGVSVFIDQRTRLLVQGITGRDGSFHTRQMIGYGTKVVAGVTPGKGGQLFDGVVPVFDTVADAARDTRANTAVTYVPAPVAASPIYEAA